ncbi:MAG: U32 family peptidase, partial [Muribaculaceae bacterium]|nr:U32 family peptidase [Muribaculaceae bacterium]
MTKPRELELLAPARDAATAIAAIDHGADAVYIGAAHHGARSAAGNSLEDIKRVAEYAHRFRAKVYVTLNTLVYDDEITEVEYLVGELYRAGIDALIVQDLSLLRMSIPPIALHASTQCDIRTPEKARFLQSAGFKQLVLARELTLDEIRAIRRATTVPLEAFVHGALCVSYSGNCQASFALTGRSANRGECAQICRYAYDLIDGDGRRIVTGKHLLSLKDMNRIASLSSMIDAGVSSFKIEGRLKDIAYVKTVTAAYRQALDRIITASDGRLRRSSFGESE